MDAIVLVGGQGTRLRPLTARRHKSLVPVLNRPAIAYLFEWLAASGIDRVVLALGQNNDDLAEAYPEGRLGTMDLRIVKERERLESGGAIRYAVQQAGIEGRFAVLNGDVFVEFDFRAMLAEHERVGAKLSQYLYPVTEPWRYGVAVVDERSMITGFVEKPPMGEEPGNLVNAGVWIFEPELVGQIPPGAVRVEETLFPSLVARRQPVLGYTGDGIWADIGTPQSYLALNQALLARAAGNAVAATASVAAGAVVEGSAVGDGAVIGAASVSASVLWENVTVGDGASVAGSVLADGVVVGAGARVRGVIAGPGTIIAAGVAVPPGTLIDKDGRYDG
ncbi:MAG TPA: NDP-sugar synthase [Tepidiformaceae bacterium]|nr:NDP-sugar synthase [Tepidiformaceae bacterium]